jgi:hypothetical protein
MTQEIFLQNQTLSNYEPTCHSSSPKILNVGFQLITDFRFGGSSAFTDSAKSLK